VPIEPCSKEFLFRHLGEERLTRWARGLEIFRFQRAYGGFALDFDEFVAALRFDSETDLLLLMTQLGMPLEPVQPEAAQPSPVQRFPAWQQPRQSELFGCPAWVRVEEQRVEIRVINKAGWALPDEADFEIAKRIESHLEPFRERVLDPPRESGHCLCPKFFPEIWGLNR
jgi:hypothetical protein